MWLSLGCGKSIKKSFKSMVYGFFIDEPQNPWVEESVITASNTSINIELWNPSP
jgi:hypothetical protein